MREASPSLSAGRDAEVLRHCEKPRSGDEAISTLPREIASRPAVARNDKSTDLHPR